MTHRPLKVIVLRHAEKPLQANDQRLAPFGAKRAEYIARWLPENFGKPDFIFATEPTKSSFRPWLTVAPLWEEQKGALMDVSIEDDAALHLGHHLRGGELYHGAIAGSTVVVCWHHGKIPELLKGLGVKQEEIPDPWPENDFSTVFVVTYLDGPDATVSKYKMLF
jgi:hypothetical protein